MEAMRSPKRWESITCSCPAPLDSCFRPIGLIGRHRLHRISQEHISRIDWEVFRILFCVAGALVVAVLGRFGFCSPLDFDWRPVVHRFCPSQHASPRTSRYIFSPVVVLKFLDVGAQRLLNISPPVPVRHLYSNSDKYNNGIFVPT